MFLLVLASSTYLLSFMTKQQFLVEILSVVLLRIYWCCLDHRGKLMSQITQKYTTDHTEINRNTWKDLKLEGFILGMFLGT